MLDIEKENEIRRLCRKYSADQLARMYLEAAEKGERRAERAEMRMVEFAERCTELENERAAMIEIIGDCRELCGICRNEPPEDCQRDCDECADKCACGRCEDYCQYAYSGRDAK